MQKAVAIAFGRKRSHLYLLHHYHQHNEEYGKRSTGYTDRTNQRLLAKLRPCLYEILLYHLNGLFLNYLYLRLLCLLWKYRRVRRFRSK